MATTVKWTKVAEDQIVEMNLTEGSVLVEDVDYVDPPEESPPTLAYLIAHGYVVVTNE